VLNGGVWGFEVEFPGGGGATLGVFLKGGGKPGGPERGGFFFFWGGGGGQLLGENAHSDLEYVLLVVENAVALF